MTAAGAWTTSGDPGRAGVGPAVLDFNYAYNPSCAHNDRYACPLAPRENWLGIPVTAGELAFPGHRP